MFWTGFFVGAIFGGCIGTIAVALIVSDKNR